MNPQIYSNVTVDCRGFRVVGRVELVGKPHDLDRQILSDYLEACNEVGQVVKIYGLPTAI